MATEPQEWFWAKCGWPYEIRTRIDSRTIIARIKPAGLLCIDLGFVVSKDNIFVYSKIMFK